MKKLIFTILFIGLTGCSFQQPFGANSKAIPTNLKLKVDNSKILSNSVVPDISCTDILKPETCVNNGDIIKYKYISEEKAPVDKITEGKKEYQEDISKRRSDAQFYNLGNNKWQVKLYGGDQFVKEGTDWKIVQYATTTIDAYNKQVVKWEVIKAANATDATSTTSNDGYVGYFAGNTSWSTVRDRADGDTTNTSAAENGFGSVAGVLSTGKYYIGRGVMVFNTSVIGSGSTVSSSTLHVHTGTAANSSDSDNDAYAYVALVTVSLAATSTIANGDYDAFGTTEYSDQIDITSALTGGSPAGWQGVPLTFTLNAGGLTNLINKTGYSQIGGREGHDINNSAITTSAVAWNNLVLCNVEHTTAANRPILTVTYTTGGGGSPTPIISPIINFE